MKPLVKQIPTPPVLLPAERMKIAKLISRNRGYIEENDRDGEKVESTKRKQTEFNQF